MNIFERLSNNLASKISAALQMDREHEKVLAYGAYSIISILWSVFLIMVFGLIFNVLLEALVISFTAAVLRKYSGGAHATSPHRCAVIGVMAFGGSAVFVDTALFDQSLVNGIYGILSFFAAYFILYRRCPVDNPNKPIKKEETRRRLRKNAFAVMHIYLAAAVAATILYLTLKNMIMLRVAASIYTGMVWQVITLTEPGYVIISQLDIFLQKISFVKGGERNEKEHI